DHEVQREGGGNPATRPLNDEDAWEWKPFCLEPTLRLQLCGRTRGGWTPCQEDDFPLALNGEPRQPGQRARLDLIERLPEVVDPLDVIPQTSLLARRHMNLRQRRFVRLRRKTIGLARCRQCVRVCVA